MIVIIHFSTCSWCNLISTSCLYRKIKDIKQSCWCFSYRTSLILFLIKIMNSSIHGKLPYLYVLHGCQFFFLFFVFVNYANLNFRLAQCLVLTIFCFDFSKKNCKLCLVVRNAKYFSNFQNKKHIYIVITSLKN